MNVNIDIPEAEIESVVRGVIEDLNLPTEDSLTDAVERVISDHDFSDTVGSYLDDVDWDNHNVVTADALADRVEEEVRNMSLPDEDDVNSLIENALDRHDFDDEIDERLRYHDFVDESRVEDMMSHEARKLLESMPSEPTGRCNLGIAFQEAVLKVLRNVADGSLEVEGLFRAQLTIEETKAEEVTVEAEAEEVTVEAEPEKQYQWSLVLYDEQVTEGTAMKGLSFYGTNPAVDGKRVVGPFPTHDAVLAWAGLNGRYGTLLMMEVPTA